MLTTQNRIVILYTAYLRSEAGSAGPYSIVVPSGQKSKYSGLSIGVNKIDLGQNPAFAVKLH